MCQSIHLVETFPYILLYTRNFVCSLLRKSKEKDTKTGKFFQTSLMFLYNIVKVFIRYHTETSVQYCQNLHMYLHQCTLCNMNISVPTFTHFCNNNYDNCTTFASCKTNSGIWSLDNSLKLRIIN